MTPHALLFTLAAIGISETVYLIRKRITHDRPICIMGEQCLLVLQSKYRKTLGISNDFLGLSFYIVISFITAFVVIEVSPFDFWVKVARILISIGTLISLYFTFLQWRVIRSWCFWCLMSATTILFMALIVLLSDLRPL